MADDGALVVEMLGLRGFDFKILAAYSTSRSWPHIRLQDLSEWKHFVKVGLQGHRARDTEADR